MKPTKNKFYCKDSGQSKMLFETEKKANNFIKFNSDEIEAETGYKPVRSYYCMYCDGWHVTSQAEFDAGKWSRTERVINLYRQDQEKIAIEREKEKAERKKATEIAKIKAKEKEKIEKEKVTKNQKIKTDILGNIEKTIKTLKTNGKRADYIEVLNRAFEELNIAKQILGSSKKQKQIENQLNILRHRFRKKMEQLQYKEWFEKQKK